MKERDVNIKRIQRVTIGNGADTQPITISYMMSGSERIIFKETEKRPRCEVAFAYY